MFRSLLIANRGEIACRIIRTARRMGIHTVAIYSEADMHALHVRLADEARLLGAEPLSESYLSMEKIIEAAHRSGAEAVHPGYGLLSESPAFPSRCAEAGLIFVGPSADAMRAVGDKAAAKALAESIGVPTIPGFPGGACLADFQEAAEAVGYPVAIKAKAGGGGRGMRVVNTRDQLPAAYDSARREARLAFGDDRLLLEKYLLRPRHIEVQIVADQFGEVITFPARDCSLQRRHQKVIEETPAPKVTARHHDAISRDARAIVRAANYHGAGTVEFLVHRGSYYFLEVNVRLQVEHPITEMICDVDLVALQLRVARGEPLPMKQEYLESRGCAIEARICAEDPAEDFRPSSGVLEHLRFPDGEVRVETGVVQGDAMSGFYDSLIAKLIVWGDGREEALCKLQQALDKVELVGIETNLDFLRSIVRSERFVSGDLDTSMLDAMPKSIDEPEGAELTFILAVGAMAFLRELGKCAAFDAWKSNDGWRLFGRGSMTLQLTMGRDTYERQVTPLIPGGFWLSSEEQRHLVSFMESADLIHVVVDGVSRPVRALLSDGVCVVIHKGRNHVLKRVDPLAPSRLSACQDGAFQAPLPARVVRILVERGERVTKGVPLLMLEAMKTEISINAPSEGTIGKIFCKEGQSVREGELLVEMASD